MKLNYLCQLSAMAFVVCSGGAEPVIPPPPREVLDVSLEQPVIITTPGPEFQDKARHGAMILGMDRTPKGRIWGCWTGNGDKPDSYFLLATSDDGGTTWSKPRLAVSAPDPTGKPQRRALVGNVWTDPLGRVWLFFDQSLVGFFDGRAGDWYIRCDNPDAAEPVWSKPVRIADGCTLAKPTVLKNGDWLLPVALWTRDKIKPLTFRDAYHDLDPNRMAHVFVSTDQGETWTRRGGVTFPQSDFDEHMIVELRDGRLWMLARTKYGMAESFSPDKGCAWTEPKPAEIKNVSARFFIRRLASGQLLLVKNGPTTERLPKRSHMSAFLSDDDGKTWRGGLLLDERASVSYPDGFQAPDGLIHILYDWNRHTDAEILMTKFREEDVLAGKFVSPDAKPRFLVNKALGPKPKPARVRVILDTDMSGDCDDAGTLALLHALADRDECELLAVVTNRKDKTNASAAAVDAINTYYGRPNIPIGTDKVGPTDLQRTSSYTRALRDEFPHDAKPDDQMPDALDVYRRVLAAQPDDSVTICSIGAFSNLAELWRREPALVLTKVHRLVVMGGEFPTSKRPETNVRTHREAARVVAAEWPTELVWHGFEVGNVLITGAGVKNTPKNNPVRRAYELKPFGKRPAIEGGQPSWDQGAALYAVRGPEPVFWRAVRGGRVTVDEEGVTTWEPGPVTRHYYAKIKGEPAKLAAVIESLMVQPPKRLASAAKPNVVIVLTDDQGYGDLSCHGNPVLKTPHLDRLYAESVRFTDFHAAPMCTPTRGQLMSGVDCLRNGAMNVSSGRTMLRRELPTMADVFAAGGYRCGQFGKWHLGDNYPYRPHDRGFHEAVWYPSSHIGSAPDFWNNHYFDDTYYHNGRREKFHGYTTDVFFGEAMKWMRAQVAAKKPFFCYIPTAAAHGPLFVPQKYRDLYKDQKPNVASFFGMIANIDENMGRLEGFLRETGLRDDTIVIFMTDNGGTVGVPIFNAGMKGGKVTLWEGGHRVPCFIRWPGGKLRAPGDVAELAQVQDILPTLAELCVLRTLPNARFDGASLAPLLQGKADALPDRMLVINYSRMGNQVPAKQGAAVLWKRWRLLEGRELYDLTIDPQQKQNVIEKFPEVAAKMRAHLDAWWRKIEPTINDFGAVIIGNDAEDSTQLSPADWQDSFLDQGRQVREGLRRNGAWNVIVDRAGDYEFELRRWPREADAALAASLPARKHTDGEFPLGVALPIAKARLKIGSFDESRVVAVADKSVTFTAKLAASRTQLQTWFCDAEGKELCGAYYVYVRRK